MKEFCRRIDILSRNIFPKTVSKDSWSQRIITSRASLKKTDPSNDINWCSIRLLDVIYNILHTTPLVSPSAALIQPPTNILNSSWASTEKNKLRGILISQPFVEDSDIYAGKDVLYGGTCLGVTIYTGILVILTNFLLRHDWEGLSKGKLIHRFRYKFCPWIRKKPNWQHYFWIAF